ncbi:MAG: Fic family protein [Solirubrobacteraceae bacterium]
MDIDLFAGSPMGRLVPISGTDVRTREHYRHHAFLPEPLPREIDLPQIAWTEVARAEAALGRLDQAARQVPEPALLRMPAIRREAQSTSALEGTFAPFEEVLGSDPAERQRLPAEIREVLNYVVAADHAFEWVVSRPITLALVQDLQAILVKDTAGEHGDAGRLRDRQVVIGSPGSPMAAARFVPPPPGDQLRAGVERWIEWVGDGTVRLPPVVRAAMAHYQFECLHPFSDGNGRIGRLLIVAQLLRQGALGEPILVVSPWFEARRDAYQDGLLELSASGVWGAWIRFFAQGVAAAADETRETVDRMLDWREGALQRVRRHKASGLAERVAGELIGAPFVDARAVADRHDVTHQGAMNALRRLAGIGLVDERRRGGRVVFVADEVVRLLAPPASGA